MFLWIFLALKCLKLKNQLAPGFGMKLYLKLRSTPAKLDYVGHLHSHKHVFFYIKGETFKKCLDNLVFMIILRYMYR